MVSVRLLHADSEARLTPDHVHKELERIGLALGRDFRQFLVERDGGLYFEAPEGALRPENWKFIPRYGTEGGVADSPVAFALFFLTITSMPFAPHHIMWADFCWECFEDRVGAIIEAFRGSGKSIFMRVLMAYFIGLYPEKSSLVLRSADTAARKTAEGIAKIISDHQAWRLWFPPIEPKSKPGQAGGEWSAQAGYSVVDISRAEDEWNVIEAARTSPTLTKFGLGSKSVLGSRVTLAMLADDLHDEENSESPAQLERMISRFQGIVENSRTPESRLAMIGTPWAVNDLLQQLPRTGEYRKLKTPITLEGTYPGTPTWPEHYDESAIDKLYNKDLTAGKIEFKRNQLLDLEAEVATQMTWNEYPYGKIQDYWPVRIGVDFAELEETASGRGRSYFCAACATQEPQSGSWIFFDGFLGQIKQEQAENVIVELHDKYKGRTEGIFIEAIGGGAVFAQMISRLHKDIKIVEMKGDGVPKEVRWERMIAPNFGRSRALVSNKPNHPFLERLRQALLTYPRIRKRGDWAADIFDAMVWALFYAFYETGDPLRRRRKQGETKPNPYYAIAGMK